VVVSPATLMLHVIGADTTATRAVERALTGGLRGRVIVATDLALAAEARATHPRAWIVVAGIRRCEVGPALDAGADIALAGPVHAAELRARIGVLSRAGSRPRPAPTLEFDPRDGTAWLDGSVLTLTPGEYALLRRLAERPGRVVTKTELAETARAATGGRALERRVARLRRRLGRHGGGLVTIRGVGYRLDITV